MSTPFMPVPKTHKAQLYCPICHTKETPWGWKDYPDHPNGEPCCCKIVPCMKCTDGLLAGEIKKAETVPVGAAETIDLGTRGIDRREGDRRK
jgi:hypothetical protein